MLFSTWLAWGTRSGHVYMTIRIKNNVQKMDKKKMVEKKLCLLSTLATMLLRQIRFSPAQPVRESQIWGKAKGGAWCVVLAR